MSKISTLHPKRDIGTSLRQAAYDILSAARAPLDDPSLSPAVVIHDYRKEMKRWRAFLRLFDSALGDESTRLRTEARDLARTFTVSRDIQSALDALDDLLEDSQQTVLSPRSIKTIRDRLAGRKRARERAQLTAEVRARISLALDSATTSVAQWPLDAMTFADVAEQLAAAYRRATRLIPEKWPEATPEELHELRQRVVQHRYQMELVEDLWPRLTETWIGELQRLRTRLGKYQDLTLLIQLIAPHQPLAPWRSRLAPLIAQRQAEHVVTARRIAGRVFAESPKAFRRRLEALWEAGGGAPDAD
jgi:CHAD domain-containing protein